MKNDERRKDAKTRYLTVRISEKDYARVKMLALAFAGGDVSKWVRDRSLSKKGIKK